MPHTYTTDISGKWAVQKCLKTMAFYLSFVCGAKKYVMNYCSFVP